MHAHHRCHSHESEGSTGPAWFYGYHHDSGQMKMMTYPEYMNSMQTTYSKTMSNPGWMMQQWSDTLQGHHSRKPECGCGCKEREECDCECHCHVHCADTVEYARCGEQRRIPITFENDTRRDREVTLTLGAFATRSGKELGWQAALSDTTFTLPACGEKTVMLTVPVQCGGQSPTGGDNPPGAVAGSGNDVDSCEVAYATLRAEGCRVRPLVIAVAVLPNHCEAYHAECGCGCC
jgi:hypothetical protein